MTYTVSGGALNSAQPTRGEISKAIWLFNNGKGPDDPAAEILISG